MAIQRSEFTARYANIVVNDNTVYLAGVIPKNFDGSMTEQSKEVFFAIDSLLDKSGSDKSKILSMQCFISSFEDFDQFNEVYDNWVDAENLPARATMQATLFDPRVKIEIVLVAAI
ncbi:RidA family protein [Gammaproteobacteria bacterium]|jgi:enamine deaminase RidA (YjgF/YER057c/UK114 family)|nr:RidA family protein [Gammaproteobacteria bacterium]